MTRKDFELLAQTIRTCPQIDCRYTVAEHFADTLAAANPRFDKEVFIAACMKGHE